MSLRGKFHLLLAVFGLSIAANMAIAVLCIRVYVDTATERFHTVISSMRQTDRIRTSVDELVDELNVRANRSKPLDDNRYRVLSEQIREQIAELPSAMNTPGIQEARARLVHLGSQLSQESEAFISLLAAGRRQEAAELLATTIEAGCVPPLREGLWEVGRQSSTAINQTAAELAEKQTWVTGILAISTALVFLVVALSFHLVRYGMLKPLDALRTAAERHAAGDLQYRIVEHSRDELGALSRQVNVMADSLAALQRRLVEQERLAALGELASSVAHNIRNPLANIRGTVQMTMKRTPECEADLARVIDIVDSLNQWLQDLLSVHKSVELECRDIAVRGLVERVVAVIRPAAESEEVSIELDPPQNGCVIHADSLRLGQALLAVVSNAVEASPPEGVVRLTIHDRPESPGQVNIQVSDSGPGIPAEIHDRLASPFSTTKHGGTGIGLYLAKRVVTAHGGELGFQENPSGGTIVTLSLPSGRGATTGETGHGP